MDEIIITMQNGGGKNIEFGAPVFLKSDGTVEGFDIEYAQYLDLIAEDGEENAQSYSDAALLMTQYKGAVKRFNSERM